MSIYGIPQVMAFLQLKAKEIDKQKSDSMKKIGGHMQNEVKSSISGHEAEPTSVDTGNFMRSVDFDATPIGVIIFSDVSYAKHLEWGTSRMKPRKHFQNSFNRNKQKVISILKEEIDI